MRRLAPFAFGLAITLVAGCPAPRPPQPLAAPVGTVAPVASASPSAVAIKPDFPADPYAEAVRDATLKTSQAFTTMSSLANEVGPRLSGSPGYDLAVAWAVKRLTSFGLVNVHTEEVMVPHWERGAESASITAPRAQPLAVAALGGSVGTPAGGIEAEVIEAGSLDEADKLDPARVKGKILFLNMPTERHKDGSGYGKSVRVRGAGASHGSKLGAVAVVIRSIGTDTNRLPHTGAMRYEKGVEPIPAAAISTPDADTLHALLAQGSVKLKLSLGAVKLPDAKGANVIGEVRGREVPDEIVLLGAHLDSWDLGLGAIDDGAGIAIVTEAARQMALRSDRPRRTLRVVLYANEENGLAGADAYAKAHASELAKHVMALEADFGGGAVYEVAFLGPKTALGAFASVAQHLTPLGVAMSPKAAHGGADLSTLLPAGVPFIDLHQDGTTYFDIHHTANDTPDKVDKHDLDQAAATCAAIAAAAANGKLDFGRIPEGDRKERW
jgi:hypothetical protein